MTKKWVNIADVLFFQEGPGVRNTQYTTSGVKLLNVANLVDGKVDLSKSDRYISEEEAYGKYRHFLCDDGDFVIASSGIKVEYIDKKMGFVDASMLPLCMNTSTIRFKVLDENQLRIRYFMYYLKSKHFKEQLTKQITGSAQLNYGPSHLKKMIMPLIDITVQDEIISCMDKLQSIIETRQRELIELDRLMKARFVEMFGDPIQNPKGWDMPLIEEVVANEKNALKAGPFGSALKKEYYVASGYKIYGQEQVISGDCTFGDYYIDEERYKSLENCAVQPGDVLISLVGTYGKLLIMPEVFEPGIINPRLMKITFDKEKVNPYYFKFFFQSESLKKALSQNTHGGTMDILNLGIVRKIEMPLPPLKLQNEFVDFVHQVNKSKVDTMTFAPIYAIINLYLHTYFYQGRR